MRHWLSKIGQWLRDGVLDLQSWLLVWLMDRFLPDAIPSCHDDGEEKQEQRPELSGRE